MLDPCEQAILEEEGAWPGVRMPCGGRRRTRRSCREGLELAAAAPNAAQLLVENSDSVSHSWSWKGSSAMGTPAAVEELLPGK